MWRTSGTLYLLRTVGGCVCQAGITDLTRVVAPAQHGNALVSVYNPLLVPSFLNPFTMSTSSMGSQASKTHDTLSVTERGRSTTISSPYNIHGNPIPTEASIAPEDTQDWYTDLWEKACCVPHKDGKSIIVFTPAETGYPDPRVRAGWPIIRLRQAYELLGEDHPRIVRYEILPYL